MSSIDIAVFSELRDTAGAEFVTELVDTFLEEAPGLFDELRDALEVADAERFRRAAHSIKSNSATFGALGVAGLARSLELDGLSIHRQRDDQAIVALRAAYEQAAAELKELARG